MAVLFSIAMVLLMSHIFDATSPLSQLGRGLKEDPEVHMNTVSINFSLYEILLSILALYIYIYIYNMYLPFMQEEKYSLYSG